jgi:hypothetical protein
MQKPPDATSFCVASGRRRTEGQKNELPEQVSCISKMPDLSENDEKLKCSGLTQTRS